VVEARVVVPVKVEVPVTPRFKVARREPSKVRFVDDANVLTALVNNTVPALPNEETPVPPEVTASAFERLRVPMVLDAMVVVANVDVPVKVDVPVTPRLRVAKRVPSKVKLAESMRRPPVVANGTRPLVSDEIAN
jgi:hypothetical protein